MERISDGQKENSLRNPIKKEEGGKMVRKVRVEAQIVEDIEKSYGKESALGQ